MPYPSEPLSDEHRAQLEAVKELISGAKALRDQAIVQALKAGASTRTVGKVIGLSSTQVGTIGKAHGWPLPETKAELARRRRERELWWERFEAFVQRMGDATGDATK